MVFFVLSMFVFFRCSLDMGLEGLVGFPFGFQISRIGVYSLWFSFGFLVGAPGFAEGLLAGAAVGVALAVLDSWVRTGL